MLNPFIFFSACFKRPAKIQMEQYPAEKYGSSPIIQCCSGKSHYIRPTSNRGRPISNHRKLSNHANNDSFRVEINLTRILSIKRKNSNTKTEQPVFHHLSYSHILNTLSNEAEMNVLPCCIKNTQDLNREEDEIQYKKEVAKRWRKQRDRALQQGVLNGYETCGNDFEEFNDLTNNVPYLYSVEFKECVNCNSGILLKKEQQVYLSKKAFKPFFNDLYGIMPLCSPCEAYIILPKTEDEITIVKIVEKMAQTHNNGSFETKIWSSLSLKKEYEITLGEHYRVEYAVCLNNVLEIQYKNLNLRKIKVIHALLRENNVSLFFGEDPDYLQQLNSWTRFQ